jgi:hypothetical protein
MISWQSAHNSHFNVGNPDERGKTVPVWVEQGNNVYSCELAPRAAREAAAELVLRANVIDPLPKQSAGPKIVFRDDGPALSSARLEAELINGELALRLYPNASSGYRAVAIPIEDVRSVLAEIRDVAFPDERCPF